MNIKLYILFFILAFQTNAQIADFNHINLKKADSIALTCKNENLNNLPFLTHQLTSGLNTDVERFRAIYKWVCSNIKNDYKLYYKNDRKRKKYQNDSINLISWNNGFRKTLFNTLIKKKRTICTGYAYLIKELAELSNLECKIINGYGKTSSTTKEDLNIPNHSWNAVKLNNKWYLCDATWASGIQNPITMNFEFQYNNGFFLTNPELFAINHYPKDSKWLLIKKQVLSFKTFLDGPILYNNAFENLANHKSPSKMHHNVQKNENVAFEYQLKKHRTKEHITLLIDNGFKTQRTKPSSITIKNNSLTFNHSFTSTGFYDVHLYFGDDLISTYTFKVKS